MSVKHQKTTCFHWRYACHKSEILRCLLTWQINPPGQYLWCQLIYGSDMDANNNLIWNITIFQVSYIIAEACDIKNLAQMYEGWTSWVWTSQKSLSRWITWILDCAMNVRLLNSQREGGMKLLQLQSWFVCACNVTSHYYGGHHYTQINNETIIGMLGYGSILKMNAGLPDRPENLITLLL